jgi:hypothetical protein
MKCGQTVPPLVAKGVARTTCERPAQHPRQPLPPRRPGPLVRGSLQLPQSVRWEPAVVGAALQRRGAERAAARAEAGGVVSDRLNPDAMQALMRHKSYSTTRVYINIVRQMDEAVAGLHVPDVLKSAMG